MLGPLNRAKPAMPVNAYTTFGLSMPKQTHWRSATCAEVDCAAYRNGWTTIVPNAGPQAQYIRAKSGRAFTEEVRDGGLVAFTFKAGQRCFAASEHRLSLQRAPIASLRGGDWRAATTPTRRVGLPEWVDRFANNQSALADRIKRG